MDAATVLFDACTQVLKEDYIAASAVLMARANSLSKEACTGVIADCTSVSSSAGVVKDTVA